MTADIAEPHTKEVIHRTGEVLHIDDAIVVRAGARTYRARRAAGCLLEPTLDDRVLLAISSAECWVIEVLERAAAVAVVSFEGDLALRSRHGSLSLTACEHVCVRAGEEVSLASKKLRVAAVEGEVTLQQLGLFSRVVDAQMDRVRYLAKTIDSAVDRLSQRLGRWYRRVDDLEHARVGSLDQRASGSVSLGGRHTVIAGDELVKLNGDQIHLG